jgi:polyisoprenoid-binding protein YceI
MIRSLVILALTLGPAFAAPDTYHLSPGGSTVAWATDLGETEISGTMPIDRADLELDFAAPATSRIRVVIDAAGADASLPFAVEAMRGENVLHTTAHPKITFAATGIRTQGNAATVDGLLTIRGTTLPIRLAARFFRPPGSAEGDLSRLSVQLTGKLSRSAYGAAGFADLVGDEVRLNIVARIARED